MGIQLLFRSPVQVVGLVVFFLSGTWVHAGCFDFSKKITAPLREVSSSNQSTLAGSEHVSTASGQDASGKIWGAVSGLVVSSADQVFDALKDHELTRSPRVKKMTVTSVQDPNFSALHDVHFEINPFPFVTIEWNEKWAYAVVRTLKTSKKELQQGVISYEKTRGTSHISHLCGSIVVNRLGPDTVQVYQYEEAIATNRSEKDTIEGLRGTLKALRERNKK